MRAEPMMVWTDYPIVELGDIPGERAPMRQGAALSYDGDKYVTVQIGDIEKAIKAGYLYDEQGRAIDHSMLEEINNGIHERTGTMRD